jgi:hypothetical protein
MSDLHRAPTEQASRRVRRCIACFGPIAKGEVYKQQTGFFDGRAYRNHYHCECWDALSEEGTFEFAPGDLPWPERLTAEPTGTQEQSNG